MASFTDSPQALGTFNPYVQQLPVEAMVKVGMQKQEQYNQGIQKIQTSIDNIAGLDIAKDSDKAYLQSKVNELGNNLKFVAAGDFSDFQLVNSVNGMTTQLVKDPNVQNAVSSTAWLRKQQAEMEKAISEGKSSQSNIYDFNEKANTYLSSSTLGEKFNGRYTQYTDVKKKAMEAIKALHPKMQEYDIPFEVDGNGNVNTKKIADAMIKYKIEGIDEKQIQQAIYASMTPDDLNQIRIDSKYQFRGVDSTQLVGVAQNNYDTGVKEATENLEILKNLRAITTDPAKISQIDDRISDYQEELGKEGQPGKLAEQLTKNIEEANSNPEEVKYSLYKNSFIKEFGNAFSWKNESKEYVTNPLKAQENWRADMKLKQQEFQQKKYEFGVNVGMKREELALKAEENALTKAALYGVEAPWTPLGNDTDNTLLAIPHFNDHLDGVTSTIDSANSQLINAGYTQKEVDAMLIEYEKNQGVADVPAKAIGMLQTLSKNKNYLKTLETFQKDLKSNAEKKAGISEILIKNIKGRGNVSFTTDRGQKITITPKELVEILASERKQTVPSGEGTTEQTYIEPNKSFNANQKKYIEAVYGFKGALNNNTRSALNNIVKTFRPAAAQVKGAYEKADELYQTELGKRSNAFVPQIKAVANPKGEVPPLVLPGLNQLLIAAKEKNIAANRDFDFETASGYFTDKQSKDTRVYVKQNGENYEIQIRNLNDNATPQVLTVSANEVRDYLGAKYVNENTQASTRMGLGLGKSDIRNKNIAQEAEFQKSFGDFPNIRNLKITANLDQDLQNPNAYIPTIYLQNKDGKYISFELSGSNKLARVDYASAKQNFSNLDDNTVLRVLKQNYPNFDFSTIQQ
jgi:hypothetical protein